MRFTRWINPMLPQTLHIATLLFYIRAVFGVLFGFAFNPIGLLLTVGYVLSGLGIANSLKWGYQLAVATSIAGLAVEILRGLEFGFGGLFLFSIIFPVALVALVVHPMSRDHQKIWFE